jgi:hypothetical protein
MSSGKIKKFVCFYVILAHFLRLRRKKCGLSAPSPRICQCKSCGLSAPIQDAWASSEFAQQIRDQPLARAPAAAHNCLRQLCAPGMASRQFRGLVPLGVGSAYAGLEASVHACGFEPLPGVVWRLRRAGLYHLNFLRLLFRLRGFSFSSSMCRPCFLCCRYC